MGVLQPDGVVEMGPQVHQHGLLVALGYGQPFPKRPVPSGLQFLLDARGNLARVHPAVGEQSVGEIAVVGRSGQNKDAKAVLHPNHPGAWFWQRRKACSRQRPWDGHTDSQQERQNQGQSRSPCIEITGKQHDLKHDRRHARPRQQRGDRAHSESQREASTLRARADRPREA